MRGNKNPVAIPESGLKVNINVFIGIPLIFNPFSELCRCLCPEGEGVIQPFLRMREDGERAAEGRVREA
jgi:hypothetical protein